MRKTRWLPKKEWRHLEKKIKPYNLAFRVLLSLEQFAGGDKSYKNKT